MLKVISVNAWEVCSVCLHVVVLFARRFRSLVQLRCPLHGVVQSKFVLWRDTGHRQMLQLFFSFQLQLTQELQKYAPFLLLFKQKIFPFCSGIDCTQMYFSGPRKQRQMSISIQLFSLFSHSSFLQVFRNASQDDVLLIFVLFTREMRRFSQNLLNFPSIPCTHHFSPVHVRFANLIPTFHCVVRLIFTPQNRGDAALKIQTNYRGYRDRKRVGRLREERSAAREEHKVHNSGLAPSPRDSRGSHVVLCCAFGAVRFHAPSNLHGALQFALNFTGSDENERHL